MLKRVSLAILIAALLTLFGTITYFSIIKMTDNPDNPSIEAPDNPPPTQPEEPDNPPPPPTEEDEYFTVTFKDGISGEVIDFQQVKRGEDAVLPQPPQKEGYTFSGWNGSHENVQQRLEITAIYNLNSYTITMRYLGTEETETVYYNSDLYFAEPEGIGNAFVFGGWFWDKEFTSPVGETATMPARDIEVYGKYSVDFSKVTVYRTGDMVYGGGDDLLTLTGLRQADGIEYTIVWKNDSGAQLTSSEESCLLRNVGNYEVVVEITATYGDVLTSTHSLSIPVSLSKAPLEANVIADSAASLVYGDFNPEDFTAIFSGFQYDDGETLSLNPTITFVDGGGKTFSEKLPAGSYSAIANVSLENYDVTVIPAYFTVEKRVVSIDFGVGDITYGEPFTPVISGGDFVYGEDLSALGAPLYKINSGENIIYGEILGAGEYDISVAFPAAENYVAEAATATFIVDMKDLRIGVGGVRAHYVYGETPEAFVVFEGLIESAAQNGETLSGGGVYFIKDGKTYSEERFTAGIYTVGVGGYTSENYNIIYDDEFDFTVSKKEIKNTELRGATAYTYGETPSFSLIYDSDEFVFGEDGSSIEENITKTYAKVGSAEWTEEDGYHAGDYTLTVAFNAENYAIYPVTVNFTINRRALIITFSELKSTYTYGDPFNVELEYAGFLEGEEELTSTAKIVIKSADGTEQDSVRLPAGTFSVTVEGVDFADYKVTLPEARMVTVNKKQLTAIVSFENFTYGSQPGNDGETIAEISAYDGFVYGDDENVISGTPSYTYTRGGAAYSAHELLDAGSYTVAANGLLADNYTVDYIYVRGTDYSDILTVYVRNASVTLSAEDFTYGEAPSPSYATDNVLEKDISLFNFAYSYSAANGLLEDGSLFGVGNYVLTVTYTESSNYNITVNDAEFTVKRRALVGTAHIEKDNFDYGNSPAPYVTFEGFAEGEDISCLTQSNKTPFTYITRAGAEFTSDKFTAGNYYAVLSEDSYASDNYDISYSESRIAFTVNKLNLTFTVELDNTELVYGEAPRGKITYNAGELAEAYREEDGAAFNSRLESLSIEYYSVEGGSVENNVYHVGEYKATCSNIEVTSYNIIIVPSYFTVSPRDLVITVGLNAVYEYGDPVEPGIVYGEGFVYGETFSTVFNSEPELTYYHGGKVYEPKTYFEASDTPYTVEASGLFSEDYTLSYKYIYGNIYSNGRTAPQGFTVTKKAFTIARSIGTITTFAQENWSYSPTFATPTERNKFHFNGTVKLVEGLSTGTRYTATDESTFNKYFVWENGGENTFSITLAEGDNAGLDVTENFDIGYNLSFTLIESIIQVELPEDTVYNGHERTFAISASHRDGYTIEGDVEITYSTDEQGSYSTQPFTAKNAGTYTVYYKVTANYYPDGNPSDVHTDEQSGSFEVTIDKAVWKVTPPNIAAVTYSGKPIEYGAVTVAGEISGDSDLAEVTYEYTYARSDSSDFSSRQPLESTMQLTDAGTYRIYYTVAETDNYYGYVSRTQPDAADHYYTVVVNRAQATIDSSAVEREDYVYSGENQYVDLSAIAKTGDGILSFSGATSTSQLSLFNAGFYTVTVTLSTTNNYSGASTQLTFNVAKAEYILAAELNQTFTYNGEAQGAGLFVTLLNENDSLAEGDVEYGSNGYRFTDAGTYTVNYIVKETGNYNSTSGSYIVTIDKAEWSVTANSYEKTYDGTPVQHMRFIVEGETAEDSAEGQSAAITSYTFALYDDDVEGGFGAESEIKDVVGSTRFINAGRYTVYYKIPATKNYNERTGSYTVTIKRAEWQPHVIPVSGKTYDGTEYALSAVTSVSVDNADAVIEYIYDFEPFIEEHGITAVKGAASITLLNAGTYTVRFTISGKEGTEAANNYTVYNSDENSTSYTFTISRAQWSVYGVDGNAKYADNDSKIYDKKEVNLVATGSYEVDSAVKGNITVNSVTADGIVYNSTIIDAHIYEVKYGVAESNNYEVTSGTFSFAIEPKELTVTVPENSTVTYSGVALSRPVIVNGLIEGDAVAVDYTVNGKPLSGNPSFTDAGIYDVRYSINISSYGNYILAGGEGESGSYTLTINKAEWSITVPGAPDEDGNYRVTFDYAGVDITKLNISVSGIGGNTATPASVYKYEAYNPESVPGVPTSGTFTPSVLNHAGKYTVTVTAKESTNFNQAVAQFIVQINQIVYNGEYPKDISLGNVALRMPEEGNVQPTLATVTFPSEYEGCYWVNGGAALQAGGVNSADVYYNPNANDYITDESKTVTATFTAVKEKISIGKSAEGGVSVNFDSSKKSLSDYGQTYSYVLTGNEGRTLSGSAVELTSGFLSVEAVETAVDFATGGTYKLIYRISVKDNYYFEEGAVSEISVWLKLNSVTIGSTYYTIEDALNAANSGTVTVKYNTSFASSEVIKEFGIYQGNSYYTVKSGVTLSLPYDGSNTQDKNTSTTFAFDNPSIYLKLELKIPSGTTLTNNGTVTVGGITSGGSGGSGAGQTSGDYAQITLGEGSEIISGGTVNCWGFIVEEVINNGSRVTLTGGSFKMPFIIREHRGGTKFSNIYSNMKGSPFNRYFMQNVTALLTVKYGATLYGYADLYASSQHNTTDVNMVGNDSKSSFIQLLNGSRLEAKYDRNTKVTKWDTFGNININSLSLKVLSAISVGTASVMFPLTWYYNIVFNPENASTPATVTSSTQDIKIMPGGSLTVERGVTMSVPDIFVYDENFVDPALSTSDVSAPLYETGKGAGKLTVNGTLKANNIGGHVLTEGSGAILTVNKGTNSTSYELRTTQSGVGWQEYDKYLELNVYNSVTGKISDNAVNQTRSGAVSFTSKNGGWDTGSFYFSYDANGGNLTGNSSDEYAGAIAEGTITTPDPTRKYHQFTGWYYDSVCTQKVGEDQRDGAAGEVITVYAGWKAIVYNVNFNVAYLGGYDGEKPALPQNITWRFGSSTPLPAPERVDELKFSGWFMNENYSDEISEISDDNIDLLTVDDGSRTITIYANFMPEGLFEIRYDANGRYEDELSLPTGTTGIQGETVDLSAATYAVNAIDDYNHEYYFDGWIAGGKAVDSSTKIDSSYFTNGVLVLSVKWARKAKISVSISAGTGSSATVTLTPTGGSQITAENAGAYYFRPDTEIKYSISLSGIGDTKKAVVSGSANSSEDINATASKSGSFHMPAAGKTVSVTATCTGTCIVEGTLITMSDGTQKPVEELAAGDRVLSFNHETGRYEEAALWLNIHKGQSSEAVSVINLRFLNGALLRVVDRHGLFDLTLNKYVFITENNANEYIGHRFAAVTAQKGEVISGETVLTEVKITEETVRYYSPVSVKHMNVVAENLLTVTPLAGLDEGLFNVFEYGENMTCDREKMQADIDKYGLYTYEDFKEYIPYEVFIAAPWSLLKISVEKGYISWDAILWNINFLLDGYIG